ncbi:MAG: hypothetical protein ACO2PO_14935 [Candidatus Calescibacterium sp.]|jgi:hypothetical protein
MLGKELLDIVAELIKDILNALRDAVKQKDILYFVALIMFLVAFIAGMIFAIALIIIFITLLTNTLKSLPSTIITITGFIGIKKGGGNENQNMEKGRETER